MRWVIAAAATSVALKLLYELAAAMMAPLLIFCAFNQTCG